MSGKVFQIVVQGRPKGFIVADDAAAAQKRLRDAEFQGEPRYSPFLTAMLMRRSNMTMKQRAFFYRNISMRLQMRASVKDALASVIVCSHELPIVKTASVAFNEMLAGRKFSQACRSAGGIPESEINFLAAGEKAGKLKESVQSVHAKLSLLLKIKKEIVGNLALPITAFVILWAILFPAFSGFLPHIYDTMSSIRNLENALSPFIQNTFNFSLFVRDTMPFSAFLYYSLPAIVWAGARAAGVSSTDIFSEIGIFRRFYTLMDMLQAVFTITQQLKFEQSMPAAAAEAIGAVKTREMRRGLSELVIFLQQGDTISVAAQKSSLPLEFIGELIGADKTDFFAQRLENYNIILYNELEEQGEKLKIVLNLMVLSTIAMAILAFVIFAYVPSLEVILLLGG